MVGTPEARSHSHRGAAPGHWHGASQNPPSFALGPMLRRLQSVGSYYRAQGRQRRKLHKSKPMLVRHVALRKDGAGATFELRGSGADKEWTWSLDPELLGEENLWNLGPVQAAITEMETELRLPMSWPPRPEDKRTTEERQAEREANIERLRLEAEEGKTRSLIGYWSWVGAPVTNPSALVQGRVYHLGFALAIYRGSFHGPKWHGLPGMDEFTEPEETIPKRWFTFEGSDLPVGERPRSGIRLDEHDFDPRTLKNGEVAHSVRAIPVSHDEALAAFEWEKAEYLR